MKIKYIQNYPKEFEINDNEFFFKFLHTKKGIAIYYYGKIRRKIAKFFNSDVKFNSSGPFIENVYREKYER